jgi:hypothetical protein
MKFKHFAGSPDFLIKAELDEPFDSFEDFLQFNIDEIRKEQSERVLPNIYCRWCVNLPALMFWVPSLPDNLEECTEIAKKKGLRMSYIPRYMTAYFEFSSEGYNSLPH